MAVKATGQITLSSVIDVKATYRYYLLQSSTLATPSKPSTYPPSSTWDDTEPSYSEGNTDSLYFVDCTVFCDDTFLYSEVSLSSSYEAAKVAYNKAVSAQQSVDDTANDIHKIISEQNTSITSNCEEIIMQALESYTQTGDFEEFQETVQSQLELLSDEMLLKITETSQQLEDVNNDLQEKFNTITKYFTFDINGLTIGQIDNPYKVIINNDRYSMTVNDHEVMWISNGKVYTPEIEVTKGFKLFGYLIDQDENGNVSCEYVGGES